MALMYRLMAFWFATTIIACVSFSQAAEGFSIKSFDSQGVKIFYATQGQGEPVVLIHGWLSSAGINWMLPGTFSLLAENHQVI